MKFPFCNIISAAHSGVAWLWILLAISRICPAPAIAEDQASDVTPVVALFELVLDSDEATARKCLGVITQKVQNGELRSQQVASLRSQMEKTLAGLLNNTKHPLHLDAAFLAASWGDTRGTATARKRFGNSQATDESRLAAFAALVASQDKRLLSDVDQVLGDKKSSQQLRRRVLSSLGRLESSQVAGVVLKRYRQLEASLRPQAIELLTQRVIWAKALLAAIGEKQIPASALNANQVRRLLTSKDAQLKDAVTKNWGTIRQDRNPARAKVIDQMREVLQTTKGDPRKGEATFTKLCGQCHKIYGRGYEVGPDITVNGRNSFEQLLSNVFDPSLVIGVSYQARTVITVDGRVLTGLLAEDNQQRIVLKQQGGKLETIARDNVDEILVSRLSLMPEGIENQYTAQELADLFAFLALDKHPSDPQAKYLPGYPQ